MNEIDAEFLNDSERQVLRLLAEGHTIKSAAALIGSTPSALNERLREARRKTGVGSSRELARRLTAQENRDNGFGVAGGSDTASPFSKPDTAPGVRRKGWIAVTLFCLTAAAATIAFLSQPSPDLPSDPLLGHSLPDRPTPAEWQKRLLSEKRDPSWANEAEALLRQRYARIGNVGAPASKLRVTCAATVCEVAGLLIPNTDANGDPIDTTMRDLQEAELFSDLHELGLHSEGNMFTSSKAQPKRSAFFAYFTKIER